MENEPALTKPELVADIISENIRNGTPQPLGTVLLKAGYAKSSSLRPSIITSTEKFKARLIKNNQRVAKELAKARNKALKDLDSKLPEAKYRDVAYAIDIFTKNERLITGQATENVAMQGSLVVLPSKDAEFETEEMA